MVHKHMRTMTGQVGPSTSPDSRVAAIESLRPIVEGMRPWTAPQAPLARPRRARAVPPSLARGRVLSPAGAPTEPNSLATPNSAVPSGDVGRARSAG